MASPAAPEHVFLTWALPSEDFALLNYRAFESILSAYGPSSTYHVLVFAPEAAKSYKFANSLSVKHFQKYSKSGYPHISFELINGDSHGRLWGNSSTDDAPGSVWFGRWKAKQWPAQMSFRSFKAVTDAIPEEPIVFFSILAAMWETGGLFVDLDIMIRTRLRCRGIDMRSERFAADVAPTQLTGDLVPGTSKSNRRHFQLGRADRHARLMAAKAISQVGAWL